MKNNVIDKLNNMSGAELKEIIDNSFLYDAEIVDKAKELFAEKNTQPASVDETTTKVTSAPVRKKRIIIASISFIVVLVATLSVLFGIRANTAQKYVLVEESNDNYVNTYEYEFDSSNRITKRYTYMDGGELESIAFYDEDENIYEQRESDDNVFYKGEYEQGRLVKETTILNDSIEIDTLKDAKSNRQEWVIDIDGKTGTAFITVNSRGDVVKREILFDGSEILHEYDYEYDKNGNKTKSVFKLFGNDGSTTKYTYITIKDYKNRKSDKSRVVNGNIKITDCSWNVVVNKYDISKASVISFNEKYGVEITFTKSGREKIASATERIANEYSENGLNYMSIYVDDELVASPSVAGKLDVKTLMITQGISNTEADTIVEKIYGNKIKGEVDKMPSESNNKKLRIATNAEFEPFEYMENGKITGFDIELMTDLCERIGYEPEFVNVRFDEIMTNITTNEADCGIAAITITDERKMNVDFTDIYISAYIDYGSELCLEELAIAVKKGSPLKDKLNTAIQEAITDGTIDNLAKKYNIQY